MVTASTSRSSSSRTMLLDSIPAEERRATTGSRCSGPEASWLSIRPSRSCDSPSVVPTETSTRRERSSSRAMPASDTAILAAATENWPARPSSPGSTRSIHSDGSKPSISQPLAYAYPVVSKAVIGLTPLRPVRSPVRNSVAEVPMLVTVPRPVTTTRCGRRRSVLIAVPSVGSVESVRGG